ncbi:hypothetical protein CcrBL47_gp258c [Caulobacter phage BL47]|nr:hypothetical protein CcrBL47_gp258c [Caulobacter phage BL47]
MNDLWSPKVGELVKYVAISRKSRKPVNIRAEKVRKVTDKFIYAGIGGQKFRRGAPGRSQGYTPKSFSPHSTISSYIEPLADVEAAVLPKDVIGGSQYARKFNFENQTA